MKLALGTAQLGSAYGVANKNGQLTPVSAQSIVRLAESAGIDTIDTAVDYGDAELRLGAMGVVAFRVITKLALPEGLERHDAARWTIETIRNSSRKLGPTRRFSVLTHRSADLLGALGNTFWGTLQEARESGLVDEVGFSVYEPNELRVLLSRFRPDIVQLPMNVLDRRFKADGLLEWLRDCGIEVHTRSTFLQGLLAVHAVERPLYFESWRQDLGAWDAWCESKHVSPVHAALAFVVNEPLVDRVIVGVDSAAHLSTLIDALVDDVPLYDGPGAADLALIDPRNWNPGDQAP